MRTAMGNLVGSALVLTTETGCNSTNRVASDDAEAPASDARPMAPVVVPDMGHLVSRDGPATPPLADMGQLVSPDGPAPPPLADVGPLLPDLGALPPPDMAVPPPPLADIGQFVSPDGPAPPPPVGYVRIEPGVFTMGSPANEAGRDADETQHQVTLTRPFLMKTTEVTQGEWQALMGDSPSFFAACGATCPAERVSWYEAVAYTNALSTSEGLPRCYADAGGGDYDAADATIQVTPMWRNGLACTGYRLPTEAEWEYAARAGTVEASYNGAVGDVDCNLDANLDPIAWYCGDSGNTAHPVGAKRANAWGLYDMLGNLYEWNWDWYGDYPAGAAQDPTGSAAGGYRVFRGGSWVSYAQNARSAFRGWSNPKDRYYDVGFRPARSL